MFAPAVAASFMDGADLRFDGFPASRGGLPHQRVNCAQHAPTLAFCEPAGMGGIFRHRFAHDETLRLPETRRRRPQRPRRLVVEHERELSHTTAILPYLF